jgi:hypothetical protein
MGANGSEDDRDSRSRLRFWRRGADNDGTSDGGDEDDEK